MTSAAILDFDMNHQLINSCPFDKLYKKCDIQKKTSFSLLYKKEITIQKTKQAICIWGKGNGNSKFLNTCLHTSLGIKVFGKCAIIFSSKTNHEQVLDFQTKQYHRFLKNNNLHINELPTKVNEDIDDFSVLSSDSEEDNIDEPKKKNIIKLMNLTKENDENILDLYSDDSDDDDNNDAQEFTFQDEENEQEKDDADKDDLEKDVNDINDTNDINDGAESDCSDDIAIPLDCNDKLLETQELKYEPYEPYEPFP